MKIVVLIKQVPDTETRIKISGNKIDESSIKWIVSPFDEHALEEALRLREKSSAEVIALSLGPARTVDALQNAYALGVDKAVHLKDDSYNVLDVNYTSAVLAKYLESASVDLILCGHIAIDSQSSMVAALLAERLGIANINNAVEVNLDGDKLKVRREIEGGLATMETSLPALLTATKNLNDPRYPSLKGIMASKKKQVETVEVSSLGVDVPKIEIVSLELPPPHPPGRVIEGDSIESKSSELVKSLREEAKVL